MPRCVVFIDYQNFYKGAREAFGWEEHPANYGNFRPLALGRLVCGEDRTLEEVRVYTGLAAPERNRPLHGMMNRRIDAWRNADPGRVKVYPRTLRYPPPKGREKGVDVHLAVDFVRLAIEDRYDIGILCSADTDLLPALEFVARRFAEKAIETIAWKPIPGLEGNVAAPLDPSGGGVRRRRVSDSEFGHVVDKKNYFEPQQPAPGQSGRRLPPDRGTG
jgi:uncharacterized LabA/DUF88 family protein